MVVDDLDVDRAGSVGRPFGTDSVDANAVLAPPVTPGRFQAIAAQGPKIVERCRGMQYRQSSPGLVSKTLKGANEFATGKAFGISVPITANYPRSI